MYNCECKCINTCFAKPAPETSQCCGIHRVTRQTGPLANGRLDERFAQFPLTANNTDAVSITV